MITTLFNLLKNHKIKWTTSSFSILGVIWLLVDVFDFLEEDIIDKIYIVLFALILSLILGLILTYQLISKIKIPISSGGSVEIFFGDILNAKSEFLLIPVSDFFDYNLGTDNFAPVNASSILGQLIIKYQAMGYDFSENINSKLQGLEISEINEYRKEKKIPFKKYKIGSMITLSQNEILPFNLVMLATSKTRFNDKGEIRSESTLPNIVESMSNGLGQISHNSSIAIPLIGAGYGRLTLNKKQLLEVLLSCIIEHSQRSKSKSKISIILDKRLRGEFPLYALRKEWQS
jgi:hypothetical protein